MAIGGRSTGRGSLSARPTPPRRENQASRAKSKAPGLAGPGGGSRMARKASASPGSMSAASRSVTRMRAGSRSFATPVMRDGAISRRSRPPAVSAMSTTLPLTL